MQFCTVLSCFLSAWAPLFVAYYKCLSVEVWFCVCVMICCRLCLSASGSLWKLHYVRFPPVSRCSYLELHYLFCSSVFLCFFFFLFVWLQMVQNCRVCWWGPSCLASVPSFSADIPHGAHGKGTGLQTASRWKPRVTANCRCAAGVRLCCRLFQTFLLFCILSRKDFLLGRLDFPLSVKSLRATRLLRFALRPWNGRWCVSRWISVMMRMDLSQEPCQEPCHRNCLNLSN